MTPKQEAARRLLYEDFPTYAKSAVYIRTKDQRIATLNLNRAQRHLLAVIDKQIAERGFVRIIILKGRQMGSSTFVESWLYWWVSQRKAQRCLVVAHDIPSTTNIFSMTKLLHDRMPEILRPHTSYKGKKELEFDILHSSYRIATAGGDGIVRGDTVTCAHLSEVAWWPKNDAQANFSGLMDAIPSIEGTAVFEESTANGYNLFYEHYGDARHGRGLFEAVFLPWFWADEYRSKVTTSFERSPEEEELVAKYGLDDEQLMFRRQKIVEKGTELFRQEYPCDADEAFLTSGRPVFHPERVQELDDAAIASPPPTRMALEGDEWLEHPIGELYVYKPLNTKHAYSIGVDVGMGVRRDFSVACVLDENREQVAVWRSDRINEDRLGSIVAALGRYYNDALICCERNGPGILTCRVLHKDEAYTNVFQETVYDKAWDIETERVGFTTNQKSKSLVIGELRAEIRDRTIKVHDYPTIQELRTYIVTDTGKLEADATNHDDCVIALALANHVCEGPNKPIINVDADYEVI